VIPVPYHLGRKGIGMGLGPLRYLDAGAEAVLRRRGVEVQIRPTGRNGYRHSLAAIGAVNRALASQVRAAVGSGEFPLVLGGNCNTCLGTLGGLSPARVGIVWFDAHGDFNTPATSRRGFIDGMPLAIATGHCHRALRKRIGCRDPIPEGWVVHVGSRALDREEGERLRRSQVLLVPANELRRQGFRRALLPRLMALRSRVREVYLHLDIDVLDPHQAPGVDFPAPNGLGVSEVQRAIQMIGRHFRIAAAALTAFNPRRDDDDKTLQAGLLLMQRIVVEAGKSLP